jgi:hypothetical protein
MITPLLKEREEDFHLKITPIKLLTHLSSRRGEAACYI